MSVNELFALDLVNQEGQIYLDRDLFKLNLYFDFKCLEDFLLIFILNNHKSDMNSHTNVLLNNTRHLVEIDCLYVV